MELGVIADDTDDNVSGRKFRAAQPGMPQLTGDRGDFAKLGTVLGIFPWDIRR